MMRLAVLLILTGIMSVYAQDVPKEGLVPRSAIKLSPFHLWNFYPSLQLAYEHAIHEQTTLQLDAGWVFSNEMSNDYRNKRGVKLKFEARHYFDFNFERDRAYYGAFEIFQNAVNFDREGEKTECFDGSCNHTFTRRFAFVKKYRENGVSLKFGKVRHYRYVFFDLNIGLSLRNINYKGGEGIEFDDFDFFDIPNERDRIVPAPCVGIRIGHRFR